MPSDLSRPNAEFGKRLRRARLAAKLSADVVAAKMGAARSTYYSWEDGSKRPRDIRKLASAVRSSVAYLFGERS